MRDIPCLGYLHKGVPFAYLKLNSSGLPYINLVNFVLQVNTLKMKIKILLISILVVHYAFAQQVSEKRMKQHLKNVEKSREKGTVIWDMDTVFVAGVPYCIIIEKSNGAFMPSDYSVRSLKGDELIYVKSQSYTKPNTGPVYNQNTPATTTVWYHTYYFTDTKNMAEVSILSSVYKTVVNAELIKGNYIDAAEEDKFVTLNGMKFSQDDANSNAQPQTVISNTNVNTSVQQQDDNLPGNGSQNGQIYSVVQVEPKFVGDLNTYLSTHLMYPADARANRIQGTVYVSFIVEPNGAVSNVYVLRQVYGHQSLENEAVRVVSIMPNWLPGTQDGRPVRVRFTLPVRFVLN